MTRPAQGPAPLQRSARAYERLLVLYPTRYRAEYGPAMAQHFRDLARDAYDQRRRWGLTGLWLRVLADTGRSAGHEHWLELAAWLRCLGNIEAGWMRTGWPALLLATLFILAGIFGKSVMIKQFHSAAAGAGMIVVSSLLAAVVIERQLRGGGQLLAAAGVVIVSLVLPLTWTSNALEWLRLNPITGYTVTLLPFAWQQGRLSTRTLWTSTLIYSAANILTAALIGP